MASSQHSSWKSWLAILLWVGVFVAVGAVIGGMTKSEIPVWYESLVKPPLNPPNFVFGIVWTVLYIFMGIAGYRIWRNRKTSNGKIILGLFAFQTFLNWAWSYLFFYFHMLGFSATWLAILVATVTALVALLRKTDSLSFALLTPYLVWICFALYLNFSIWQLN